MLAALFGFGEILFCLGEQASKVCLGRCGHGGYGAPFKTLAPPPDLITGWRGRLAVFPGEGRSTGGRGRSSRGKRYSAAPSAICSRTWC